MSDTPMEQVRTRRSSRGDGSAGASQNAAEDGGSASQYSAPSTPHRHNLRRRVGGGTMSQSTRSTRSTTRRRPRLSEEPRSTVMAATQGVATPKLTTWKKLDLVAECTRRGLSSVGNKHVLATRLMRDDTIRARSSRTTHSARRPPKRYVVASDDEDDEDNDNEAGAERDQTEISTPASVAKRLPRETGVQMEEARRGDNERDDNRRGGNAEQQNRPPEIVARKLKLMEHDNLVNKLSQDQYASPSEAGNDTKEEPETPLRRSKRRKFSVDYFSASQQSEPQTPSALKRSARRGARDINESMSQAGEDSSMQTASLRRSSRRRATGKNDEPLSQVDEELSQRTTGLRRSMRRSKVMAEGEDEFIQDGDDGKQKPLHQAKAAEQRESVSGDKPKSQIEPKFSANKMSDNDMDLSDKEDAPVPQQQETIMDSEPKDEMQAQADAEEQPMEERVADQQPQNRNEQQTEGDTCTPVVKIDDLKDDNTTVMEPPKLTQIPSQHPQLSATTTPPHPDPALQQNAPPKQKVIDSTFSRSSANDKMNTSREPKEELSSDNPLPESSAPEVPASEEQNIRPFSAAAESGLLQPSVLLKPTRTAEQATKMDTNPSTEALHEEKSDVLTEPAIATEPITSIEPATATEPVALAGTTAAAAPTTFAAPVIATAHVTAKETATVPEPAAGKEPPVTTDPVTTLMPATSGKPSTAAPSAVAVSEPPGASASPRMPLLQPSADILNIQVRTSRPQSLADSIVPRNEPEKSVIEVPMINVQQLETSPLARASPSPLPTASDADASPDVVFVPAGQGADSAQKIDVSNAQQGSTPGATTTATPVKHLFQTDLATDNALTSATYCLRFASSASVPESSESKLPERAKDGGRVMRNVGEGATTESITVDLDSIDHDIKPMDAEPVQGVCAETPQGDNLVAAGEPSSQNALVTRTSENEGDVVQSNRAKAKDDVPAKKETVETSEPQEASDESVEVVTSSSIIPPKDQAAVRDLIPEKEHGSAGDNFVKSNNDDTLVSKQADREREAVEPMVTGSPPKPSGDEKGVGILEGNVDHDAVDDRHINRDDAPAVTSAVVAEKDEIEELEELDVENDKDLANKSSYPQRSADFCSGIPSEGRAEGQLPQLSSDDVVDDEKSQKDDTCQKSISVDDELVDADQSNDKEVIATEEVDRNSQGPNYASLRRTFTAVSASGINQENLDDDVFDVDEPAISNPMPEKREVEDVLRSPPGIEKNQHPMLAVEDKESSEDPQSVEKDADRGEEKDSGLLSAKEKSTEGKEKDIDALRLSILPGNLETPEKSPSVLSSPQIGGVSPMDITPVSEKQMKPSADVQQGEEKESSEAPQATRESPDDGAMASTESVFVEAASEQQETNVSVELEQAAVVKESSRSKELVESEISKSENQQLKNAEEVLELQQKKLVKSESGEKVVLGPYVEKVVSHFESMEHAEDSPAKSDVKKSCTAEVSNVDVDDVPPSATRSRTPSEAGSVINVNKIDCSKSPGGEKRTREMEIVEAENSSGSPAIEAPRPTKRHQPLAGKAPAHLERITAQQGSGDALEPETLAGSENEDDESQSPEISSRKSDQDAPISVDSSPGNNEYHGNLEQERSGQQRRGYRFAGKEPRRFGHLDPEDESGTPEAESRYAKVDPDCEEHESSDRTAGSISGDDIERVPKNESASNDEFSSRGVSPGDGEYSTRNSANLSEDKPIQSRSLSPYNRDSNEPSTQAITGYFAERRQRVRSSAESGEGVASDYSDESLADEHAEFSPSTRNAERVSSERSPSPFDSTPPDEIVKENGVSATDNNSDGHLVRSSAEGSSSNSRFSRDREPSYQSQGANEIINLDSDSEGDKQDEYVEEYDDVEQEPSRSSIDSAAGSNSQAESLDLGPESSLARSARQHRSYFRDRSVDDCESGTQQVSDAGGSPAISAEAHPFAQKELREASIEKDLGKPEYASKERVQELGLSHQRSSSAQFELDVGTQRPSSQQFSSDTNQLHIQTPFSARADIPGRQKDQIASSRFRLNDGVPDASYSVTHSIEAPTREVRGEDLPINQSRTGVKRQRADLDDGGDYPLHDSRAVEGHYVSIDHKAPFGFNDRRGDELGGRKSRKRPRVETLLTDLQNNMPTPDGTIEALMAQAHGINQIGISPFMNGRLEDSNRRSFLARLDEIEQKELNATQWNSGRGRTPELVNNVDLFHVGSRVPVARYQRPMALSTFALKNTSRAAIQKPQVVPSRNIWDTKMLAERSNKRAASLASKIWEVRNAAREGPAYYSERN